MKAKHAFYLFVIVAVLAGTLALPAAAQTKPKVEGPIASTGTVTRGAIEDISGSYAAWDNGAYGDMCWSGGTDYLCFNYHVESYTWAWPYGLQMKLPTGWNATNGYLLANYSCSGGGYPGDLYFTGGNEPVFSQTWYLSSSGDVCDAVYCMDVTTGGSGVQNWYITSDGFGGGVVSTCDNGGYYSCDEAVMPPADVQPCAAGIYLTPATQDGLGCEGETVDYTLGLFNNSGADGTFDLTYDALWPISGPSSIFVANGTTESFGVSVTIPCGGIEDTGSIYASGGGFSDSASVHTAVSGGGWIDIPASPVAVMDNPAVTYNDKLYVVGGYNGYGAVQIFDGTSWTQGASDGQNDYVVDVCLGLNASGNPVIDLFGDTSEFFNVRRYDINANSWSTFAFPPGFPAGGLWAPDIVSMYQHTGENVCYISGGATTPGGGNTNALYAYNPATQAVTNLGNFSYLPTGIAFHFSWYVPWVNGICAGGGVDANSVVSGDTQCFDLDTGLFNGVNADLGPLPQPWWGGGDAWMDGGQYEIWGVNGVDAAFALLQKSFYWDGSALVYGPDPLYGVYRMEADNFAGSIFAANGSTGGFSPSTLEEWLLQCLPCGGDTVTCGDIGGWGAFDPYGRPIVKWKVWVVDQVGSPVGEVAVTADMVVPTGATVTRTRMSYNINGVANFHWGSPYSGFWSIDVTNMVKAGYTFVDGPQCYAEGSFNQ